MEEKQNTITTQVKVQSDQQMGQRVKVYNVNGEKLIDILGKGLIYTMVMFFIWWIIPELRYRNDKTEYYKIDSATTIEETVTACNDVSIVITRTALVDLQGRAISELVLVRADQPDSEVLISSQDISVNKGVDTVIADFPVPCKTKAGKYFWRGTVKYQIRGYDHITTWRSNDFQVRKATQIALP